MDYNDFAGEEIGQDLTEEKSSEKTDSELLREIHAFMGNINDMLVHVAPALEGISKSPIGKMLGIK